MTNSQSWSARRTYLPSFFFFNDTATTEIYTLSLHDALPISSPACEHIAATAAPTGPAPMMRSEEHTSELQSRFDLVCRLLLEKKKNNIGRGCHSKKNNELELGTGLM